MMQPSNEEFQETGRQLERIARAAGLLGQVYRTGEPDFLDYNETQRSEILQAWTQVSARTGHHDLAILRQARVAHDPPVPSPNGLEDSPHHEEVRRNLLALRDAASLINDPQVDPQRLIPHNQRQRDIIIASMVQVAYRNGHHLVALRHHHQQPPIPFRQLTRDPILPLGLYAFHLLMFRGLIDDVSRGRRIIQPNEIPQPVSDELWETYQEFELHCSLAHRLLWYLRNIADPLPGTDQEFMWRYCRRQQDELNRQRRAAASRVWNSPEQPGPPDRFPANLDLD